MGRAFLMAMGISACIMGAECLAMDRFVLAGGDSSLPAASQPASFFGPPQAELGSREYKPPEWMAWTLLSGGAIVILYSTAMRQE